MGNNNNSKAMFFAYEDIKRKRHKLYEMGAVVGRDGVTVSKKEGNGSTPDGVLYFDRAFDRAFSINYNLKFSFALCSTSYARLNDKDYWIDDTSSKYYDSCRKY